MNSLTNHDSRVWENSEVVIIYLYRSTSLTIVLCTQSLRPPGVSGPQVFIQMVGFSWGSSHHQAVDHVHPLSPSFPIYPISRYHLVICYIAMENPPIKKKTVFKPSISIRVIYTMAMLNNLKW